MAHKILDCLEQNPQDLRSGFAEGSSPRLRLGERLTQELERAAQYRQQAAELLLLAERVATDVQRSTLIGLATTYHRMAEQLEEMHRLDIKPNAEAKD